MNVDTKTVIPRIILIVALLLVGAQLSCGYITRSNQPDSCCTSAKPLTNLDKTQKAVLKINKQYVKALSKKDVSKLDQLLADEFSELDCFGKSITKKDMLDLMRRKGTYYHSDSFIWQCTINNKTAVVVGSAVIGSELYSEMCGEILYTRIYKEHLGVWRLISSKLEATV